MMIFIYSLVVLGWFGSVAGVVASTLHETTPKFNAKKFLVGAIYSVAFSSLIFVSLQDAANLDGVVVKAALLFSVLFGIWSGGIASRKVDDQLKVQEKFDALMNIDPDFAKSIGAECLLKNNIGELQ